MRPPRAKRPYFRHRERERHLRVGERGGAGVPANTRQLEVGGIETPVVGATDLGDRRIGSIVEAILVTQSGLPRRAS